MKILNDLKIVIADKTSAQLFKTLVDPVFKKKLVLEKEFEQLQTFQDLILSKMAKG